MKKLVVCFFVMLAGNAYANNNVDWKALPVDMVVRADTTQCTTAECLLNPRAQKVAQREVVKKYGTTEGRCLAGVKRLLTNVLGSEWFTTTSQAADYLPFMQKASEFREVTCDRDRIVEYPDSTTFIYDRKHSCKQVKVFDKKSGKYKTVGRTSTGTDCSFAGHIMVKISDTREFAGGEQNLVKWSPYFGENCWAFLPADAKLPTASESVSMAAAEEGDVCWLDDTSNFKGFESDKPVDEVQDAIDKLRAAQGG